MCGRYNVIDDPLSRALLDRLGLREHLETRYNIAPTEPVPVVLETDKGRELRQMRWWLVPAWVKQPGTEYSMFNARAETLTKSPAFRHPFKQQRCIMPASSFIEWHTEDSEKQPFDIRLKDSAIAFAGLWDRWGEGGETIFSCTLITTDAVPEFRHIHRRMPVMLPEDALEQWLDPAVEGKTLLPLLMPRLPALLAVIPVDRRINNSRLKEAPTAIGAGEIIG